MGWEGGRPRVSSWRATKETRLAIRKRLNKLSRKKKERKGMLRWLPEILKTSLWERAVDERELRRSFLFATLLPKSCTSDSKVLHLKRGHLIFHHIPPGFSTSFPGLHPLQAGEAELFVKEKCWWSKSFCFLIGGSGLDWLEWGLKLSLIW